jgi:hypothetical protein
MAISGISSALGSAVGGVRHATDRFAIASAQVTKAAALGAGEGGSDQASGPDTATFSSAALAMLGGAGAPEGDLAQAFVDQSLAKNELAANVRVINTADDMMKDLLSLGGK